jgi:Zn-dependent protease with chaperone function
MKINLFLLATISLIAICVDCYAGYVLLLMFAMPIGYYLSPWLLLFLVVSILTLFISSIVGLCRLKKWAYWVFFIMTMVSALFLLYIYIYIYSFTKKHFVLNFYQVSLLIFSVSFIIYFLIPSTRRMFDK